MIFDARILGNPCKVFALEPNWSKGPRMKVAYATDVLFGRGDRESRTPRWAAPRIKLTCDYTLAGAELSAARTWLATLGEIASPVLAAGDRGIITAIGTTDWQAIGAPIGASVGTEFVASGAGAGTGRVRLRDTAPLIAVPIWPDARIKAEWADRIWEPQAVLVMESGDIITGAAAASLSSVPSGHTCVPLFFGRLSERPDLVAAHDSVAECSIEIVEEGPWATRITARPLGEISAGVFPALDPDWTKLSDESDDRLERESVGDHRSPLLGGLLAPSRWAQDARFTLENRRSDLGALLAHWSAVRGRWLAFDLPVWLRPHAVATPETPDAIRARYAKDELELEFTGPGVVRVAVRFIQCPWELNLPAGEAPEQQARAYFYEVTYDVPAAGGGVMVWRFTAAERDLVAGGQTYLAAPIEHGDIIQAKGLAASEVDLKSGPILHANGNPFSKLLLMQTECPLRVVIREGFVDLSGTVTGLVQVYAGDLVSAKTDGKRITCGCGRAVKCRVPRVVVQQEDSRALFVDELDPLPWSMVATVLEIRTIDGQPRVILLDRATGIANPASGYFAGGWIETGIGWAFQRRGVVIHQKDADAGADLTITLDRLVRGLQVGHVLRLFPGYTRQWAQAQRSDFLGGAAASKFFGFPYMPRSRPDSTAPNDTDGGGKKG